VLDKGDFACYGIPHTKRYGATAEKILAVDIDKGRIV